MRCAILMVVALVMGLAAEARGDEAVFLRGINVVGIQMLIERENERQPDLEEKVAAEAARKLRRCGLRVSETDADAILYLRADILDGQTVSVYVTRATVYRSAEIDGQWMPVSAFNRGGLGMGGKERAADNASTALGGMVDQVIDAWLDAREPQGR
jgi:hypothetical protein